MLDTLKKVEQSTNVKWQALKNSNITFRYEIYIT